VPKPVFHSVTGKKSSSLRAQQEVISPQHAELINFIYECELHMFCLLYVNSVMYENNTRLCLCNIFFTAVLFLRSLDDDSKHFLKVQHVIYILY